MPIDGQITMLYNCSGESISECTTCENLRQILQQTMTQDHIGFPWEQKDEAAVGHRDEDFQSLFSHAYGRFWSTFVQYVGCHEDRPHKSRYFFSLRCCDRIVAEWSLLCVKACIPWLMFSADLQNIIDLFAHFKILHNQTLNSCWEILHQTSNVDMLYML